MKKKRGDQKLIIKIMLMVIIIVLGVLYKVSSSTIVEDQLEEVENQVATTLYKENQGAGGNGGSGGTGSVIPGGGDSENNGSENGGSQTVDKTTVQELPNYATKLDPNGVTPNLTTKTVVGQDLDSLKNALVSNNVLSESEAANIDGIVVITGDVSNVGSLEVDTSKYCNSGETVVVVTYDEAKKTYSYIGKGTVDSNKKIETVVNGGSSKTEFAYRNENNQIVTNKESEDILTAGIYDANGNLIRTWEESGIDVEKDYDYSTYRTDTASPYYVLTNSYPDVTKIVLPNGINKIGNYAFYSCKKLTSVVIPDSVNSIGNYSFSDCQKLVNANIPDSITNLGSSSYQNCISLTSVTIPKNINTLKDGTFMGCKNLINIVIPDNITTIECEVFTRCNNVKSITIGKNVTSIQSYSLPSSFVSLDNFINNSKLDAEANNYWGVLVYDTYTNGMYIRNNELFGINYNELPNDVVIPYGVTSIKTGFPTTITSVEIPDTVTNIDGYAFYNCTNLSTVYIPDSATSIGNDAFYNIPHVTYNGTATGSPWGAKSIN